MEPLAKLGGCYLNKRLLYMGGSNIAEQLHFFVNEQLRNFVREILIKNIPNESTRQEYKTNMLKE